MTIEKLMHGWVNKSSCWCSKFGAQGTQFGYCSEIICTGVYYDKKWHFVFHVLENVVVTTLSRVKWILCSLGEKDLADNFTYEIKVIGKATIFTPKILGKDINLVKEGIVCTI